MSDNDQAITLSDDFLPYKLQQLQSGLQPNSPWELLQEFKITPLSQLNDDKIYIPKMWVAAGGSRGKSNLTIDVLGFIPANKTRQECVYHEREIRRTIFALLMIPRRTASGVRQLGPHAWAARVRVLLRSARWILENHYNPAQLFGHLTVDELIQLSLSVGVRNSAFLNNDLLNYASRGLLNDVPQLKRKAEGFNQFERSRKNDHLPTIAKQMSRRTQPFPDAFITPFISKCLFLSLSLGPAILRAFERLNDAGEANGHSQQAVFKWRADQLKTLDWKLPDGSTIPELPFAIRLRSHGGVTSEVQHWPPQTWWEVRSLFFHLQTANYCIVAFCIGARWSEHADARIDCIREDFDPEFESRTFKLTGLIGGKIRTWPLIPQAVAAIKMQQCLAKIVGGPSIQALWVTIQAYGGISNAGKELNIMAAQMDLLAKALGLEGLADGRCSTHRWRSSVARLGAMALVDAPRVLMRLFGHKNIEMTLRYILSNPDIRGELLEAYAAATYALSTKVLASAGDLQGPGSIRMRSMLEAISVGRSTNDSEPLDVVEITNILSLRGPAVRIVRPGIMCIQQRGQYAPCSKHYGAPNPARCKPSCENRLEDSEGERHADESIAYIIEQLAITEIEQQLLRASLKGQLLTNLRRSIEVRSKWLISSPIAREVWENAK